MTESGRDLWRVAPLALAAWLAAMEAASAGPPTRAQTLGEDLSGPRLDILGAVAERFRDGDDTCFVLDVGGGAWSGLGGGKLLACYPGPFDDARFGVGQVLRVTGALGAPMARSVAAQVLEYPVAAGAFIRPAAPEYGWPAYPGYEPVVHPYVSSWPWPYYGVWYGSGWYRPGWGVWMGR